MNNNRAEVVTREVIQVPKMATVTRYVYFFDPRLDKDVPENWKQQNRIMLALANGRLVYDTGRKIRGSKSKVFESLNPVTRKSFGLKPLDELITKVVNLEFIKYFNKKFDKKGNFINE